MTIKEMSIKYDLSIDTLRYWERVGVIPPVNRNKSGYRDYDEEDENWVYYAKCMRNAGVSIEGLVDYVELFKKGSVSVQARKDILIDQEKVIKKKLDELVEIHDRIVNKIETYEERVLSYEGKLKVK